MKNLETFFELSNYDSKNITNKSNKIISGEVLKSIETEGATLETLQMIGVEIFKYRTQITIHGLFPELQNNYLNGYKNIFQNKNLSIGVKWQAVDFNKKKLIYKALHDYSEWDICHNSTDYFAYKRSKSFTDKETYKNYLEAAKLEVSHIDKSLFFGNCGVYLSQSIFGGYFLVTYINVGAILETNVNKLLENICQVDAEKIRETIEAKEAAQKAKYEQAERERKAEREQAAKDIQPKIDAFKAELIANGYEYGKHEVVEGLEVLTLETLCNEAKISARKFTKQKGQKLFRYERIYTVENFELSWSNASYNLQKYTAATCTGWAKIKQIKEVVAPQIETITFQQAEQLCIEVVDYSDRCLAIFGNTKPIKEKLKNIGAKFNPYLTRNGIKECGWVLPTFKRTELNAILN